MKLIERRTVAGLVLLALSATALEQRLLWGYWLFRPTLSKAVGDADQLLALSVVEFPGVRNGRVQSIDRGEWLRRAAGCDRFRDSCPSRPLAEALLDRTEFRADVAEVSTDELNRVWLTIIDNRKWRSPTAPEQAGWPTVGCVAKYRKDDRDVWLVHYRTSQLEIDDRHASVEAIIDPAGRVILREVVSYFDQAGMESLTLPVLVMVNLVIGAFLAGAFRAVRWLRKV